MLFNLPFLIIFTIAVGYALFIMADETINKKRVIEGICINKFILNQNDDNLMAGYYLTIQIDKNVNNYRVAKDIFDSTAINKTLLIDTIESCLTKRVYLML